MDGYRQWVIKQKKHLVQFINHLQAKSNIGIFGYFIHLTKLNFLNDIRQTSPSHSWIKWTCKIGFFLSLCRAGGSARQARDKEILLGVARRRRKIFWSAKNPLPRERDSATNQSCATSAR